MNQNLQKLTIKEKVGYSLGDVASCIFWQSFVLFLLYFYTDVFGISAAVAGTMFLFTRIWDTVNDPIMGIIADRTNTKWGKFRPYLLWMAIPFGIVGVLTFTTPNLGIAGKIIYAYITYAFMMMAYTAINIPYTSLLGVITGSSIERTSLSSYKFVGAFLGGLLIQAFTFPLVENFGADAHSIITATRTNSVVAIQEAGSGTCKLIFTAEDTQHNKIRDDFVVKVHEAGKNPPQLARALRDTSFVQGFGAHQIDLAGLFVDKDGDPLNYSVTVADPTVLAAALDGTTLRLAEKGIGATTVTITADDGHSGTTSSSFAAGVLAPGNLSPAKIGSFDDVVLTQKPREKGNVLALLRKSSDTQTHQVNLAGLFADPDGDRLCFSAKCENETIATTRLQDSLLTLTIHKTGATKIQLTANDQKGGQVNGSFMLLVKSPGGNMPVIYQPLQNKNLTAGFGSFEIDLDEIFKDPDGQPLAYSFKIVSEAKGFQRTYMLYSVIAIALFVLTFISTRERVQPPLGQKTSLKHDLLDLTKNGPWIALFFVGIFNLGWISIRLGSIIYYFKYYVGNESHYPTFLVVATIANILGVLVTKWLAARFGKRRLFFLLMLANSILLFLFYLPRPDDILLMYLIYMPGCFLSGPSSPLVWAMYADTADYSEYKTGRRATGLVFSAATFAQKMGWTIGGSMAAWLLAWFGYQANVLQTAETLQGIKLMVSIIPAGACLLSTLAMLFYPLDEAKMRVIEKELAERREKENLLSAQATGPA